MYIITTVLILLLLIRVVRDVSPHIVMKYGTKTEVDGLSVWTLDVWVFIIKYAIEK
jgi:hypothetical protein